MSELKVYYDDGGGVTQRSLEFWKLLRVPSWKIHQVTCKNTGIFTTEVVCFDRQHNLIVVLLSGLNCGYGGEGPHGLITLLEDCGFPKEVTSREVFTKPLVTFAR